jgi:hypothetical protein
MKLPLNYGEVIQLSKPLAAGRGAVPLAQSTTAAAQRPGGLGGGGGQVAVRPGTRKVKRSASTLMPLRRTLTECVKVSAPQGGRGASMPSPFLS